MLTLSDIPDSNTASPVFDGSNLCGSIDELIHSITFAVSPGTAKEHKLIALIHRLPPPGVVIVPDDEQAEYILENLQGTPHIPCAAVTLAMPPEDAQKNRERFYAGNVPVIVVDQPSSNTVMPIAVRSVIHYFIPQSLEEFVRSLYILSNTHGERFSVMLYDPADRYIQEEMIKRTYDTGEENISAFHRAILELDAVERYAVFSGCRTSYIYNALKRVYIQERCGKCDNCKKQSIEHCSINPELAGTVVRCVAETREKFGVSVLTDVLRGVSSKRIQEYRLYTASTFGALAREPAKTIKNLFSSLLKHGVLRKTMGTYPTLYVTGIGKKMIGSELIIPIELPKRMTMKDGEYIDAALLERMRNYRRAQAKLYNVPAFRIFSDRVLKEIVQKYPQTKEEMLEIRDFGEQKWAVCGEGILRLLQSYRTANTGYTT